MVFEQADKLRHLVEKITQRIAGADGSTDQQGGEPELKFGDILYAAMEEEFHIESEAWAIERVDRILARFSQVRGKQDEFRVVIPWIENGTAFTAPGRYIFFCRSLFQLCSSDEMAAMVIAHEMAHHDLGHVKFFRTWFANATSLEFKALTFGLYRIAESRIYGPEQECDADRNALELCLKVGYDGQKCISVFDILEKISLDFRDINGVYGADDDAVAGDASWTTKINTWLYQRRRGYRSIRDRKEMLCYSISIESASSIRPAHEPVYLGASHPRRCKLKRDRFKWNHSATNTDVIPAKAGIQYSAASPVITGSPPSRG